MTNKGPRNIFLTIIIFVSSLFPLTQSYAQERIYDNCAMVTDIPNYAPSQDGLSDLWAQEYTGADLLREELLEIDLIYPENLYLIIDTLQQGGHAQKVRNLISSNEFTAPLPSSKFLQEPQIKHVDIYSNIDAQFASIVDEVINGNNLPLYLNNSTHWENHDDIKESIALLSEKGTLTVTIAGNDTNYNLNQTTVYTQKASAATDLNIIIVGAMSYEGNPSCYSKRSQNVTILAPSNSEIASFLEDRPSEFGGTSAAAPQVVAALAAFTAITGYHLNKSEAIFLLNNTALKSFNSYEMPRENGVGVLNTYKIGRVAQRLKTYCSQQTTNIHSCIRTQLTILDNYQFDASNRIAGYYQAFPSCFKSIQQQSQEQLTCAKRKDIFKQIRRDALLTGNQILLQSVSCIYSNLGHYENAQYFKRLSILQNSTKEKNRVLIRNDQTLSNTARAILALNHFEMKEIIDSCQELIVPAYAVAPDSFYAITVQDAYSRFLQKIKDKSFEIEDMDYFITALLRCYSPDNFLWEEVLNVIIELKDQDHILKILRILFAYSLDANNWTDLKSDGKLYNLFHWIVDYSQEVNDEQFAIKIVQAAYYYIPNIRTIRDEKNGVGSAWKRAQKFGHRNLARAIRWGSI